MRKFKNNHKVVAVLVFYLSSLVFGENPCYGGDSISLSNRILIFARSNVGRTVNNGNCWVFPRDALAFAGARFPGRGGQYPVKIFGREIPIRQLRPGDIIHFQKAVFAFRGRVYAWTGQDHYAIVESSNYYGTQILHQNWSGKRFVIRGQVNLYDLVSGKMVFYRPQVR